MIDQTSDNTSCIVEVGIQPFRYLKCVSDCKRKPPPRSGHRVVCNNKYMYCYGGYNPSLDSDTSWLNSFWSRTEWDESKPLFRELWRYNICSRQWKKLPCGKIPSALASSSVILTGKLLLAFGGTGEPFGQLCSRSLHVCDLSKKDLSFEIMETHGDLPEPLYGQGVLLDNINLYTVGGTSGFTYSNDIHKLNLGTKIWERLQPVNPHDSPEPRYRHELAFYKGEIYIFGGGTNNNAFSLQEIPVFNLKSKEWRKEITFPHVAEGHPKPRKSHSLIQIPAQPQIVIICGGNNRCGALSDSWMLDLDSKRWHPLPLCTLHHHALHFHDTAVTPSGKMITFGGIKTLRTSNDTTTEVRSNDVLEAWVCIPKLSELCFDILLEAEPRIKSLSLTSGNELGIPSKFLARLIDDE